MLEPARGEIGDKARRYRKRRNLHCVPFEKFRARECGDCRDNAACNARGKHRAWADAQCERSHPVRVAAAQVGDSLSKALHRHILAFEMRADFAALRERDFKAFAARVRHNSCPEIEKHFLQYKN